MSRFVIGMYYKKLLCQAFPLPHVKDKILFNCHNSEFVHAKI